MFRQQTEDFSASDDADGLDLEGMRSVGCVRAEPMPEVEADEEKLRGVRMVTGLLTWNVLPLREVRKLLEWNAEPSVSISAAGSAVE